MRVLSGSELATERIYQEQLSPTSGLRTAIKRRTETLPQLII